MKKTNSIEQANAQKRTHNLFTLKNLLPCKHKFASTFGWLRRKAVAFTMAEILLSLAVIGIIAAMTLPTLTANFQDRAFNAKRQALHARLANAFRMMDYSEYMPIASAWNGGEYENYQNLDNFMEDLSKTLSIKVISDPDMIFSFINDPNGDVPNHWGQPDQGSIFDAYIIFPVYAYFQTVNGESVGILFNKPNRSDKNYPGDSICFYLVYDLNGKKGPNKWGKDMGIMGAFYYDHIELVAPMPAAITNNIVNENYDEGDPNSQKYKYPDYRLATPEELLTLRMYRGEGLIIDSLSWDWDATICAIDGKKYNLGTLDNPVYYENQEDISESACTYVLITNDGSAPKNGVIIDVPEENSGE